MLLITGNTINIFSIIGMIMGEGLVAKSGILLIDYTNTLRERGVPRLQALQEAVKVRLRPILMTSATMVFGMLPLALKLEPGAESRAPMALVVIGALLSSTVLTLVIVPALYSLLDDLQVKFLGRKRRDFETIAQPEAVGAEPIKTPVTSGVASAEHTNGNGHNGSDGHNGVPLNVLESGDAYLVRAALPGVKQEDVEVVIQGHTLTISGERRMDGEDGQRYIMHEYDTGRWQRRMALPEEVEKAGVHARFVDGILELILPKAAPDSARQVPINVDPPGTEFG
jgi:HSP20 family molecular chaperone IbpA